MHGRASVDSSVRSATLGVCFQNHRILHPQRNSILAELKNQHFVPKVHLRAFSDDPGTEKRMINLIHVRSGRAIQCASISGQCAKHYFYGKDLHLERALNTLEGKYAEYVRSIEGGSRSTNLLSFMRGWTYLQYQRTDAARRRAKELHAQMDAAIDDPNWRVDMSDEALVVQSMKMFAETVDVVEDLRTVIIENTSDDDFITSDEPAIVFNKWIHQKRNLDTFGLGSSGLCLYMPITPRLGVLSYDSNVYDVGRRNNSIRVRDGREVTLLNALLMRSNAVNIYFRNWADRETISEHLRAELPFRTGGSRTTLMVPLDGQPGSYRKITEDEDKNDFPKSFIYTEAVFPRPPRWFDFLKNKARPVVFENGTAVGPVRKRNWLDELPGFRNSPPPWASQKKLPLPGLPGNPLQGDTNQALESRRRS
ncbi:DUF4238 domain-containing protein [Sinorhizobium meliloti]|nr:DUF4238 domain-containing protein [Sinorhizobium meliloti]MDX0278252.1 DUF4238 domain-containing protein [Sinorhizobium meliloti]